ncbi:MAG: glycosyltransferase family 2 protein [Syntrophomonadaceae bacterium]|nr:glycosyltransferase family 2 protein [Syntrophomonadaceae bacterium]MDD3888490.1 glycosyltransferase family 2 protein [Syntrophomonadaceae bacterium]MDD4548730.1 glycosyltransferase family 2 protein [Syntrophomonadaceae bacterium]
MKSTCAVIPAYNEEDKIGETIKAVKTIPGITKIVVINDGSNDDTGLIARQAGAFVFDLKPNRGKGGAMNAALSFVDTDVVVFLDADLGESASQASKIIEPIIKGEADLSIAAFPPPTKKGGFGIVKNTAARAIRRAGNMDSVAPLSGQRAMSKDVLEALMPFCEDYGVELGMTIKALRKGFKVIEVPTTMGHKETGRDLLGFIHRGKQFMDVIKVLLAIRRNGI